MPTDLTRALAACETLNLPPEVTVGAPVWTHGGLCANVIPLEPEDGLSFHDPQDARDLLAMRVLRATHADGSPIVHLRMRESFDHEKKSGSVLECEAWGFPPHWAPTDTVRENAQPIYDPDPTTATLQALIALAEKVKGGGDGS